MRLAWVLAILFSLVLALFESVLVLHALSVSVNNADPVVYLYRPAVVNVTVSDPAGITLFNITFIFPSATVVWVNGSGLNVSGSVYVGNIAFRLVDAYNEIVTLYYAPLPGFAPGEVYATACTASGCVANQVATITYVESTEARIYSLTNYTSLTLLAQPAFGDAIAPHLYDWFFDGVDDYILVPDSASLKATSSITIASWIKPTPPHQVGYGGIINNINGYANSRMLVRDDGATLAQVFIGGTFQNVWGSSVANYKWNFASYIYDGASEYWVVNGVVGSKYAKTGIISTGTYNRTIGWGFIDPTYYHFKGSIACLTQHNRALTSTEISDMYNYNVVNTSGLALFLDATFFDGTYYIDLSGNNNHGLPYGGVSRVPANRTWVWIVRGLHSDGFLHLRYFPVGTIVEFSDGTTMVVLGDTNGAGLVVDFAIARTDIVRILIPSQTASAVLSAVQNNSRISSIVSVGKPVFVDMVGLAITLAVLLFVSASLVVGRLRAFAVALVGASLFVFSMLAFYYYISPDTVYTVNDLYTGKMFGVSVSDTNVYMYTSTVPPYNVTRVYSSTSDLSVSPLIRAVSLVLSIFFLVSLMFLVRTLGISIHSIIVSLLSTVMYIIALVVASSVGAVSSGLALVLSLASIAMNVILLALYYARVFGRGF